VKYNAEDWLESTTRSLKAYAEERFNNAVKENGVPVGLEAYEIVMEFAGPAFDLRLMPIRKTVIHFEVDDIVTRPVGLGDGIFVQEFNEVTGEVLTQYATAHRINFDVGIWATDASGGVTSRSRAMQILNNAFGGAYGILKLREFSDGGDGRLDIHSYTGGRFIMDRSNDMTLYRTVESNLEIGVFSRSPGADEAEIGPAITDITQDPELKITNQTDGTFVEIE
jgi:hypothetical protein